MINEETIEVSSSTRVFEYILFLVGTRRDINSSYLVAGISEAWRRISKCFEMTSNDEAYSHTC